ncbi:glycosyltransferase family 4 protein [Porticoccus sp.]
MKIANVSPYHYVKGGSDSYFLSQNALYQKMGVEVAPFCMKSEKNMPTEWSRYFPSGVNMSSPSMQDLYNFVYSFEAKKAIRKLLVEFKPDLVHLHIYYGQFTSSILKEIKEASLPIVQTVHDYKVVCPVYSLTRNGKICEDCQGKHFWKAMPRRCNRGSIARTSLSVLESYVSRWGGNISKIDRFIAVSEFQASRLIKLGIPADKLKVVHNFVETTGISPRLSPPSKPKFLYFGRLERSKGIFDALDAAEQLPSCEFIFAGSGSAEIELENAAIKRGLANVKCVGFVTGNKLNDLIKSATATLLTPTVYENCPMSVLESMALGVPVIGSRMGGISELVAHGETGLIVEPGNVSQLVDAISYCSTHPRKVHDMGVASVQKVVENFSSQSHFKKLMTIYEELGVR